MNSDPALLKTTESEEVGMRPSGGDNILCEYLRQAPLTLALWRAFECRALKELDLPRPVLDLGCGDGIFGSLLFREGADVGLDASFAETRLAKARGVYRGIVAGNIENLPFTDTCMSSVVSNCVIEHVDRLESALSSIHRILRHGGIFAFTTPSDHFNEYGLLPHLLQTNRASISRPAVERLQRPLPSSCEHARCGRMETNALGGGI